MTVAFIVRSTLWDAKGGDTVQVHQTAEELRRLNVNVDIILTHEKIDYDRYELFHFFNITRPADILRHLKYCSKPVVLSPIYIDYGEYDRRYRKGVAGLILRAFPWSVEYLKTVGRFLKANDRWPGMEYLFMGQKKSISTVLQRVNVLLPATDLEYERLRGLSRELPEAFKVPPGIDESKFTAVESISKDPTLVLCAARIEGIKNQLTLIEALNGTRYRLVLAGSAAPNQSAYYRRCRERAGDNIIFKDHLPQEELAGYYRRAKVHVLPSWFENFGLSTLEAAAMGCNVVVSDRGFISEYLGDRAWYCDPASPASILSAIEKAASAGPQAALQDEVRSSFTWHKAAARILSIYLQLLHREAR